MESYQPEYDKNSLLSDTFWRTPQRAYPGRPRPKVPQGEVMSGSSYQQFQASVNDAWDLGDDDIISGIAETKISKAISQTAALNVINSHRNSSKSLVKSDVKAESDSVKLEKEPVSERKSEVKRVVGGPGGSSGLMRHYPGRPRPVRLSALTSREEDNQVKLERFQQLHEIPVLDLNELKQVSWSGVPVKVNIILFI